MFDSPDTDLAVSSARNQLRAAIDKYLALDLSALGDDAVLELARGFETELLRAPTVRHAQIAEIADRGLAATRCNSNTAALLRQLLLITRSEASRRVRDAQNLGPRRGLTGEPLAPLFADVAAAQASASISAEHARVIVNAFDRLPQAVQAEDGEDVLRSLVMHAQTLDPQQLVQIGRRIHDLLDPDGILADDADHARNRTLSLTKNRDSSWDVRGRLSPECGEGISVVLDALSKPVPSENGQQDPRHAGQRMHDGLQDCVMRLLRSDLPSTAGLPVSILVTMSAEQWATGSGYATTGQANLIRTQSAIDLLAAQGGQVMAVQLDCHGGVLDYGTEVRIFPPAMRRAITARDRGCTFPGCDRPASWCEAHHVLEWQDFGPTAVDNGALVCSYHHREFRRSGWKSIMLAKCPYWIPPVWIDPDQVPQRNDVHHLEQRLRLPDIGTEGGRRSNVQDVVLPGPNPDSYPPIDPLEPVPDDPGELSPDTPETLPPAPIEPMPGPDDPGNVPVGAPDAGVGRT